MNFGKVLDLGYESIVRCENCHDQVSVGIVGDFHLLWCYGAGLNHFAWWGDGEESW
jgi:hypothetical protein